MKISEAIFSGSSTSVSNKPKRKLPEFAFIGRSNVGKSSLINMLCNNRKLAMTSSTPGKTRLVNHFKINDNWYLVDLPGYGYAKMSFDGRKKIASIIKDYLSNSEELVLLFVLVDSRHDLGTLDLDFINELGENEIPFAIVFTKSDKLGSEVLKAQIARNKEILSRTWDVLPEIFTSSSTARTGKEEILDYIDKIISSLNHID